MNDLVLALKCTVSQISLNLSQIFPHFLAKQDNDNTLFEPMRMISVEESEPFHFYQRPRSIHHGILRLRSRSGGHLDNQGYPRNLLSRYKSSIIPHPILSKDCGNFIGRDLDMECRLPILENRLLSNFLDHLQPRRDLSPIRPARMSQDRVRPSPSRSLKYHATSPSSCRIIPIEIMDTSVAEMHDLSEKPLKRIPEFDGVIEIADDDLCPISESGSTLARKSLLLENNSRPRGENDDSIEIDTCVEIISEKKFKPTQNKYKITGGCAKAKETLIGGANKCHLPPDDAVLVLDDIQISSTSSSHQKNLSSRQNTSSLDDDVEVNGAPAYPVYTALKEKLINECRQIDYIRGDGNCFFRAISKQLYTSERYHKTIRNLIVDLIATNKENFAQFVDGEDVQDHVECMCQEQSWATTCEIYAASTLLQRDVYMLTPDHLNETYSWLLFKPIFQYDVQESGISSHPCYLTMCNTNGNHYDLIMPEHGGCNCFLPFPELNGVSYSVDLTAGES